MQETLCSLSPAPADLVAKDSPVDLFFTKEAINQLFQKEPDRFQFLSKFNAKSLSWKDFELVFLDGIARDFARCVHCKSFVTYSSKKGTGGMLRHRCQGREADVPPRVRHSNNSHHVNHQNSTPIRISPVTVTSASTPVSSASLLMSKAQTSPQLCTVTTLNLPNGTTLTPANFQTIMYNPEQMLHLNGLGGAKIFVTGPLTNSTASMMESAITNGNGNSVTVKEEPVDVVEEAEKSDPEKIVSGDQIVEEIVSNVELPDDVSYDSASDMDDCPPDDAMPGTSIPHIPSGAASELISLHIRQAIEEHQIKLELLRKQQEVAEIQKEYWLYKLRQLRGNDVNMDERN